MIRRSSLLLCAATIASAQPGPEFTTEFQTGVDAFRLGQFDDARAHLEKARTLDPKLPGPHRFLAAVAQAQGRWQDCLDEARAALALNPQSVEAPETRKLHGECRTSAGRDPYLGPELVDGAAVAVTTNVPGASVKIGGLTYGGTPMAPRPITAGTLDLTVEKPGWKPAHLSIDALPGIVTDVEVELEPDPTSQASPELVAKPAELPKVGWLVVPLGARVDGQPARGEVELAPGEHTVELRVPAYDPWRRRLRLSAGQRVELHPALVAIADRVHDEHVGLALLGGGGALLATGFVTALISEHASADAREIVRVETSRDPSNPGFNIEPKHTRADLDSARSRATTFAVVSDVAYGAALAGIGVAAYYLYKGEREHADEPPPLAIAPTQGGAMVAKELRW
jgi:hypothetical protein